MGSLYKIYKNQSISQASECELYKHTLKQITIYGFDHFFFSITPNFGNIQKIAK